MVWVKFWEWCRKGLQLIPQLQIWGAPEAWSHVCISNENAWKSLIQSLSCAPESLRHITYLPILFGNKGVKTIFSTYAVVWDTARLFVAKLQLLLAYDWSSGAPDSLGHISLWQIDPCKIAVAGVWSKFQCTGDFWAYHCDRSITAYSSIRFGNPNRLRDIEYLCQNMRHWLTYLWQSRSFCRHFIEVLAHLWSASQRVRCWDTDGVFLAKLQLSLLGMSWPMIEVQEQLRSANPVQNELLGYL